MDKSTITLLLGVSFGLAVVGVAIGFVMLMSRAQTATVAYASPQQQYNNEESWSVVKDANGRVKGITVHREATVS